MRRTVKFSLTLIAAGVLSAGAIAQSNELVVKEQASPSLEQAAKKKENRSSPARNIDRTNVRKSNISALGSTAVDVRSIDGYNNNLNVPELGATHTHLARFTPNDYADDIVKPSGQNRYSARLVSTLVFSQSNSTPNFKKASDLFWQWGQFIDHDFGLTEGTHPEEHDDIIIPTGDPFFDPNQTGTQVMSFNRSIYDETTGTSPNNPREQINEITHWLDGSNVYGSDYERAKALRTGDGTGRLKVSKGNLLPFNKYGLPNAGGSGDDLFLAGDVRANEQIGLTAIHTLFVREHNRIADWVRSQNPSMSGEEIYQYARAVVGGQIQKITYTEFLPLLLGPDALAPYSGYNPKADPSMSNEFTTAAFRLGHSLLNERLLRLDGNLKEIPAGHLRIRDAFFNPNHILNEGIDVVLRGQAMQQAQEIDVKVVGEVQNFLFGNPGNGGFDLVALNIQRGRDHGLLSYNEMRAKLGLKPYEKYSQITSDPNLQERLAKASQGNINDLDVWAGGLAEDNFKEAMVGELFFTIMKRQFEALRDADRFWYESSKYLTDEQRKLIWSSSLASILRANTTIGREIGLSAMQVGDELQEVVIDDPIIIQPPVEPIIVE
ncbi:peroxidase family protein [Alteromonas sp. a30]|uniref:peroxidase family protein n=1 Tax=Alteromonas sp. a30 TaxID=2730917 RepID=UPI00227FEC1F|nr:peroxidase family protein [Alteromonas sp. a30]MCY7296305.1 peroxiredoxin [Alteromonas sp. a30]